MRKPYLFLPFLLGIFICACHKDMYQEKTFLNDKEQQALFAKLKKDNLFHEFSHATVDLTLAMFKTVKAGGKVDTLQLANSAEGDILKQLNKAGVTNFQEVVDLSNKQVALMKQMMTKYPAIKKVPIADWNKFIESQNKAIIKEKTATLPNTNN